MRKIHDLSFKSAWSPYYEGNIITGGGAIDQTIKDWYFNGTDLVLNRSCNANAQITSISWEPSGKIPTRFATSFGWKGKGFAVWDTGQSSPLFKKEDHGFVSQCILGVGATSLFLYSGVKGVSRWEPATSSLSSLYDPLVIR